MGKLEVGNKIYAVIPAAGSGQRFGGPTPKQYLPLEGKTLIEHCFEKLKPFAEKIVVAVAPGDTFFSSLSCAQDKKILLAEGGQSRSESVDKALAKLDIEDQDWVLIHDAVRPLVKQQDIQRLIVELEDHPSGGLLAVPVNDTVKRANNRLEVQCTEDRSALWLAQTPQMFRFGALRSALGETGADASVTDESLAMEKAGFAVKLVLGSHTNFKITRPEDLRTAELIMRETEECAS